MWIKDTSVVGIEEAYVIQLLSRAGYLCIPRDAPGSRDHDCTQVSHDPSGRGTDELNAVKPRGRPGSLQFPMIGLGDAKRSEDSGK